MTLTTISAGLIGFELARNPPAFLASYLASESEDEGRAGQLALAADKTSAASTASTPPTSSQSETVQSTVSHKDAKVGGDGKASAESEKISNQASEALRQVASQVDNASQPPTLGPPFPLLPSRTSPDSISSSNSVASSDHIASSDRVVSASASNRRVSLAHLFDRVAFWESFSAQRRSLVGDAPSSREALKPARSDEHVARQLLDDGYRQQLHENATGLKQSLDDAWAQRVGEARFDQDAQSRLQLHRLLSNAMLERWKLMKATADPLKAATGAAPATSFLDRPIDEHYPSLRQNLELFYGAPLSRLFIDEQGNVLQEASIREENYALNDSNNSHPLPQQLLPSESSDGPRHAASKPSPAGVRDAQGWRAVPRKKR